MFTQCIKTAESMSILKLSCRFTRQCKHTNHVTSVNYIQPWGKFPV